MFKGSLFESQKEGAEFLCSKKTGILAWEQGTGKTVIAIASAEKLRELSLVEKILVVAPSAIAWQWEDKVVDFTDETPALIHAKSDFRRDYGAATQASPYTITSYNLFRRDYERVAEVDWDLVICDEAQEFKNNKSKTAKLLKQLNYEVRPDYRWALTGTVISNRLEELYSIMYWVDKRFFPDWYEFEKRHVVRNPKTNQIMRYKGLQAISKGLPSRLHRRTQADVGQIPEIDPVTHYVEKEKELKDAELALLDALDQCVDLSITAGGIPAFAQADASRAFSEVKRLLASPAKLALADRLCNTILQEDPRNRVVLFSYFKQPLYELHELLSKRAIQAYFFTGDQSSDKKRQSIREFQKVPSVLLCSNAGKAGLDLPFANYLLHIDIPFSYEVLDQRNKRITRIGSEFTVAKVNYLVVKYSIEEFYWKAVMAKAALSDAVYNGTTDTLVMKTQSLRQFLDERTNQKPTIAIPPP